ncbi:hypothetical protein PR048_030959 [Dryococelus australis]|uniref:Uncharacterized protein n=1 Tax=Dryococelus australis TaxID=614101 RepID=A0ABQ9GD59_9NEOP|nr:hypothetical protein PR048_030959 [Dryococelus australis]
MRSTGEVNFVGSSEFGCCNVAALFIQAAVRERLACSSPTKANWVQSPNLCVWESCRTMPLVGGFSREIPASPALSFRRCSIFTLIAHIGSQYVDVCGNTGYSLEQQPMRSPRVYTELELRISRALLRSKDSELRATTLNTLSYALCIDFPFTARQHKTSLAKSLPWPVIKLRFHIVRAGEMGDPRENPLTSGVVRHESHLRKSGSNPWRGFNPIHIGGRRALGKTIASGLDLPCYPVTRYVVCDLEPAGYCHTSIESVVHVGHAWRRKGIRPGSCEGGDRLTAPSVEGKKRLPTPEAKIYLHDRETTIFTRVIFGHISLRFNELRVIVVNNRHSRAMLEFQQAMTYYLTFFHELRVIVVNNQCWDANRP